MPRAQKAGTSRAAAVQRRKLFIDAYLSNGQNGSAAAITAGFARKSARTTASQLLADPNIRAEVDRRREVLNARTGLTVERTLKELSRLAYSDPRKLYHEDGSLKAIHELDDDTAATVASVEVDEIGMEGVVIGKTKKLKQWDKNAALEKAMKYHGLYEKDNEQAGEAAAKVIVALDPTESAKRIAFVLAQGLMAQQSKGAS